VRVALFSDVHGNLVALEALLAELEREAPAATLCLGDVAQGGPQPAECLDRVRELGCPVVLGNADDLLLTLDASAEEADPERQRRLVEVAEWSLSHLGDDHLAFLRSFRPTVELDLGAGRTLLGFHGSLRSFDEVLLPSVSDEELERALDGRAAAAYAGGHVHLQWQRRLGGERLFVSVGSVGLAYDHDQPEDAFFFDPWAEYALLTTGPAAVEVEFRRVPFDAEAVVAATLASGRPYAEDSARGWRRPSP
jgi:predicted phosphodiesterase